MPQPQDGSQATYCAKIARDDAVVDWLQPAVSIANLVRAYRGWPQAFTTWNGKTLKLLRAHLLSNQAAHPAGTAFQSPEGLAVATGDGALALDELVLEGKRPATGPDFQRGYPAIIGSHLGS